MPRTRTAETAADKRAAILDAAERQLREDGFAGFSVAGVARELGVAQNTIYWYFPSRDDLFVAAIRRILERTLQHKRSLQLDLADEIVWFVGHLHELAPLRAALHERARVSETAAAFDREFQELLTTMRRNALRPYVPADDLEIVADVFAATVDGALLRAPDDAERRRRIVAYALERLTDGRLRPR